MYIWFLRYRIRWTLLLVLLSTILFLYIMDRPTQKGETLQGVGHVIDIEKTLYQDKLTMRLNHRLYHVYTQKDLAHIGENYLIKGKLETYRLQTIPNGFNAYHYYLSQGIDGYIQYESLTYVKKSFSIYQLRSFLYEKLEDYQSRTYMRLFLFQEVDETPSFYPIYQSLGLIFLLSASGLHLYAIILGLRNILQSVNVNQGYQDILSLVCIGIFLYLDQFQAGSTRLFLFYMMGACLRWKKIYMHKLDILQITCMLMLIFNFRWIYGSSILILYLLFNAIYLVEPIIKNQSTYLKHVYLAFIIQLVLLPFFKQMSIIMIFLMPLFILFFSKIYAPLLLIVLIFKPIDELFNQIMTYFNQGLEVLSLHHFFIKTPNFTIFTGIMYACTMLLMFRSKNWMTRILCVGCIMLLMISVKTYHEERSSLIFLDVNQGDSTLMTHRGCVIVIDAFQNVQDTLSSLGITSIDFLILTHSDIDHTKEAEALIKHLDVKTVILSSTDTYQPYQARIRRVKAHDHIICNGLKMDVLGPLNMYHDANNNSIVLKFSFGNQTFLLAGDIEEEAEFDLANHYKHLLKSDVLKVSHHGSNTSTSDIFLSYVHPKLAIISAGYQNKFGFPHQEVLQRLYKLRTEIYRTDHDGSIIFLPSKKKEKWVTYIPYSS